MSVKRNQLGYRAIAVVRRPVGGKALLADTGGLID